MAERRSNSRAAVRRRKEQNERARQNRAAVRVDLKTGEEKTPAAAPMSASQVLAAMFPNTTAARSAALSDAVREQGAGNTAGAVGASLRQIATVPAGVLQDVVGEPVKDVADLAFRAGVGLFGGDTTQGSGGKRLVEQTAKPPAQAEVMAQALEQGRVAQVDLTTPFTARERQTAAINDVLKGEFTLEELAQVSQMIPPPGGAPAAKDVIQMRAASLSQQLYAQEVKSIMAQAAAGDMDEAAAQDEIKSAVQRHYQRQAAMVGLNPANLAEAQFLSQTQGE